MDDAVEIVRAFHDFLQNWLGGAARLDPQTPAQAIARFHPRFRCIDPAGSVQHLPDLATWLGHAWNAAPGLTIEVCDFELLLRTDAAVLLTYCERQRGGGRENTRITSALFVPGPGGRMSWLHAHEAWVEPPQ